MSVLSVLSVPGLHEDHAEFGGGFEDEFAVAPGVAGVVEGDELVGNGAATAGGGGGAGPPGFGGGRGGGGAGSGGGGRGGGEAGRRGRVCWGEEYRAAWRGGICGGVGRRLQGA